MNNMKSKTFKKVGTGIGVGTIITGFVGLLVIAPILTFGFAYFGGWILKIFVGNSVVHGLNLLFNTTRFVANDIPLMCAILATVGKYFKSNQTNNNK